MIFLYASSAFAAVAFLYGAWHWSLGNDDDVIYTRLKRLTFVYVSLFIIGISDLAASA